MINKAFYVALYLAVSTLSTQDFSNPAVRTSEAELSNQPVEVRVGNRKVEYALSSNEQMNRLFFRSPQKKWDSAVVDLSMVQDVYQFSAWLGQILEADSLDFIGSFTSPEFLDQYNTTPNELPAFMLHQTFRVAYDCSPGEFVESMKREFYSYWTEDKMQRARARNLTPVQVVILASIVEGETWQCDEQPKIAALYLNRLNRDMRLQADPTVIYACKQEDPGCKIMRMKREHLRTESPYNTYLHDNLPPGPICRPDFQSIEAVLHSPQHDYIYMVANPDSFGYHSFTDNLEEHRILRDKYIAWLEERENLSLEDSLLTIDLKTTEPRVPEAGLELEIPEKEELRTREL